MTSVTTGDGGAATFGELIRGAETCVSTEAARCTSGAAAMDVKAGEEVRWALTDGTEA